jgi:hypothetical protein
MVGNTDEIPMSYLQEVASHVDDFKTTRSGDNLVHTAILEGIVLSLKDPGHHKSGAPSPILSKAVKKLLEMIEHNLSRFARHWRKSRLDGADGASIMPLKVTLEAAEAVQEEISSQPIDLPPKSVQALESASRDLSARGDKAGIKLRTFLNRNSPDVPDSVALIEQLATVYSPTIDKMLLYDFVDAGIKNADPATRLALLRQLLDSSRPSEPSCVSFILIERIVQTIQGQSL